MVTDSETFYTSILSLLDDPEEMEDLIGLRNDKLGNLLKIAKKMES